jgi:hypothetical protein
MINHDEINKLLVKESWTDKTIRNWIKELSPDRSPGRRPKK